MLGSVDRFYVFRLIAALAGGDGAAVVALSDDLRLRGLSPASTLEEMGLVLQRMAVLQVVPSALDDSDPEAAEIARLAETMPADETQLLYSMCLHGRGELGLAPDEYAALTMVLLRLLAFKPAGSAARPAEKKTLNDAAPVAQPTLPRARVPAAATPRPAQPPPLAAAAPRPAEPAPAQATAVPGRQGLPPGQVRDVYVLIRHITPLSVPIRLASETSHDHRIQVE